MSIGVIAYVNDTLKAIRELARVIRPDGLLVIQCSNSFAPTPNIVAAKDRVLFRLGLRNRRWNFKLNSYTFSCFLDFASTI